MSTENRNLLLVAIAALLAWWYWRKKSAALVATGATVATILSPMPPASPYPVTDTPPTPVLDSPAVLDVGPTPVADAPVDTGDDSAPYYGPNAVFVTTPGDDAASDPTARVKLGPLTDSDLANADSDTIQTLNRYVSYYVDGGQPMYKAWWDTQSAGGDTTEILRQINQVLSGDVSSYNLSGSQ
jgi:hypothetical protein